MKRATARHLVLSLAFAGTRGAQGTEGYVLIPISDRTRGHGTHSLPMIWKQHLIDLLTEIRR